MITYTWSTSVNTRFYAYSEKIKDNSTVTEYLSGRVIAHKNNERDIFSINCSLRLNKSTNEDRAFWNWFSNIGGIGGAWMCAALGANRYRFVSVPEPQDTDQKYVTLKLQIEEVY